MTDNTNNKSSIIPWILGGIIGATIVYYWLKNRESTPTSVEDYGFKTVSQTQPIINLNLEGFERRFEALEYRMEQLQNIQRYRPNTYLTMNPPPKETLAIAKIEKKEVKMQDKEMDMQQFNSGRGRESIDKGDIHYGKRFGDYFDIHGTTTNAVANDPVDFDSNLYDTYNIYQVLGRKADVIYVSNDATAQVTDTLFVVISHDGGLSYSKEEPLYANEVKRYNNLYSIKVRSPTQSLAFRISEYEIKKI